MCLFVCFLIFSAGHFLSNCSLNLCGRIGSENAFHGINMNRSLPNKCGPTVGMMQVLHGVVCWVNWLHSTPFSTGMAKAALKFLDIKIPRKGSVGRFRAASCPYITGLHKIMCTVSCLCLCVWTYVLISVINLKAELWYFLSFWMESGFCSDLVLGMKSSVLPIYCFTAVQN